MFVSWSFAISFNSQWTDIAARTFPWRRASGATAQITVVGVYKAVVFAVNWFRESSTMLLAE